MRRPKYGGSVGDTQVHEASPILITVVEANGRSEKAVHLILQAGGITAFATTRPWAQAKFLHEGAKVLSEGDHTFLLPDYFGVQEQQQ